MRTDRIDDLLIWPEAGGLRAAALRGGVVDDAMLAQDGAAAPGAIHRARVGQIKPEIKLGFLQLEGGMQVAANLGARGAKPGGLVTVQIVDPAGDDKLARATQRIALAGALCVAVIGGRGVTWSRQIAPQKRAELETGLPKAPEPIGVIVRRWAQDAAAAVLHAEAQQLLNQAQALRARAEATDQPRCLVPADAAQDLLREFAPFDPRQIICADTMLARRMQRAAQRFPGLEQRVTAVREGEQVADHHDAASQLARAAEQTIALADGGLMHIELTRALVAIDIDTASARGPDAIARTKQEALRAIARQLRLRDLLGRIVIDQLAPQGSSQPRQRPRLFADLEAELRLDRRVVRIAGFTPTGLLELVRSRGGDDAR